MGNDRRNRFQLVGMLFVLALLSLQTGCAMLVTPHQGGATLSPLGYNGTGMPPNGGNPYGGYLSAGAPYGLPPYSASNLGALAPSNYTGNGSPGAPAPSPDPRSNASGPRATGGATNQSDPAGPTGSTTATSGSGQTGRRGRNKANGGNGTTPQAKLVGGLIPPTDKPTQLEADTAAAMVALLNQQHPQLPVVESPETLDQWTFQTAMAAWTKRDPIQTQNGVAAADVGSALDAARLSAATDPDTAPSGAIPYQAADIAPIALQALAADPNFGRVLAAVQQNQAKTPPQMTRVGVGIVLRAQGAQIDAGGITAPCVIRFGEE